MVNQNTAPKHLQEMFAPVSREHFPARYQIEAQRAPRYVPIQIEQQWAIWDRQWGRVADGFYALWVDVVPLCDEYNAHPDAGDRDWMAGTWWSAQPDRGWQG